MDHDRPSRAVYFTIFCFILIVFQDGIHCFMDMEELKSVYYGLDILKEPVSIAEEVPVGAVHVTSKYGQQYQCTFPDHSSEEKRKEEEEKVALKTGIVEMLRSMGNNGCLFKAKDWWSYEFCYGKYIRQFHMEDGDIKGNIIYLGNFHSDFDWDNQTAREGRLKSKTGQNRYHTQWFTQGTKCDLTGQPRKAEVRFMCEENSEDYLARVDESETCVYTVTVATSRICRHPYLKAPARRRQVAITCNPLLSAHQFDMYTREREDEKLKEQQVKEKKDAVALERILEHEMSKAAKELLTKPMDELFSGSHKEVLDKTDFEKMFGHDEAMWESYLQRLKMRREEQANHLRKMKTLMQDMHAKKQTENEDKVSEADGVSGENDEDEEVISQFNDEIKEIKAKFDNSHSSISKIKRKIALEKKWETQIESAIQEAERELGVKVDRSLVSGLSNTLDKLVNKLHDTEAELASAGKELGKLKPGKPILKSKDGDEENFGQDEAPADNNDSQNKENKEDEESEDEEDEIEPVEVEEEGITPVETQQVDDTHIQAPPTDDSALKYQQDDRRPDRPLTMEEEQEVADTRVGSNNNGIVGTNSMQQQAEEESSVGGSTTFNNGDDLNPDEAELTITLRKVDDDDDSNSDENDDSKKLPDNIQKLLEESLKKEYNKKKRLNNPKPLAIDTDHSFQRDQQVHVIQSEDDDGKTNRFIFVFGLNNGNDEMAERQRQSELEDNYGFVYGNNDKKKNEEGTEDKIIP